MLPEHHLFDLQLFKNGNMTAYVQVARKGGQAGQPASRRSRIGPAAVRKPLAIHHKEGEAGYGPGTGR